MNNQDQSRSRATPVFRAAVVSGSKGELWIKNDGLSHSAYGGNKARKLGRIVEDAKRRGKLRLVTVGAAGSHHALATVVFAKLAGLRAAAVLCPQPWTRHAEATLFAAHAAGLEIYPVRSVAGIAPMLLQTLGAADYFVPAGGASVLGTLGYVDAMTELVDQVRAEELPKPDIIVVAVGSGGTAAGLLAGALREGLDCTLCGVRVGGPRLITRPVVLALAYRALRHMRGEASLARLGRQLAVEHGYAGRGYGFATPEGDAASRTAADFGLILDSTYTAKAFAKALEVVGFPGSASLGSRLGPALARSRFDEPERPFRVLYWHTLSAVPAAELAGGAIGPSQPPAHLTELLIPSGL